MGQILCRTFSTVTTCTVSPKSYETTHMLKHTHVQEKCTESWPEGDTFVYIKNQLNYIKSELLPNINEAIDTGENNIGDSPKTVNGVHNRLKNALNNATNYLMDYISLMDFVMILLFTTPLLSIIMGYRFFWAPPRKAQTRKRMW